MVVSDPDILLKDQSKEPMDFILIGSDGIFDKLENEDLHKIVWEAIEDSFTTR